MIISNGAKKVLEMLTNEGYKAYLVGGCVRDSLLGLKPKDEDIATNAAAEKVQELFEKAGYSVYPTGLQHGTVTVSIKGDLYEVTTFRVDGVYTDHRRPDEVVFAANIEDDLARRDFTMNAIAYDGINDTFVDPFNGIEDLKKGILKAVNNPKDRFEEDSLRMMRAVRFVAQKGFKMDDSVFKAIVKKRKNLKYVSVERISDEFFKIIMSDHVVEGLSLLHKTGLMREISEEMHLMYETHQENPYHKYTVGEHSSHAVEACEKDVVLRMAAFFHDIGKPAVKIYGPDGVAHFYDHPLISVEIAKKLMQKLRFPNEIINGVVKIIPLHDIEFRMDRLGIAKFVWKHQDLTTEDVHRLFNLMRADIMAQAPETEPRLVRVQMMEDLYNEIICGPYRQKDLAINGFDIMDIEVKGMKLSGKEISKAKNLLLFEVLKNPAKNTKPELIRIVSNNMKNIKK